MDKDGGSWQVKRRSKKKEANERCFLGKKRRAGEVRLEQKLDWKFGQRASSQDRAANKRLIR
jgi:cytochrome oxidase assembly protein ShyY1